MNFWESKILWDWQARQLVADLRTHGGEDDGKNWGTTNKRKPQILCQRGSLLVAGKAFSIEEENYLEINEI